MIDVGRAVKLEVFVYLGFFLTFCFQVFCTFYYAMYHTVSASVHICMAMMLKH